MANKRRLCAYLFIILLSSSCQQIKAGKRISHKHESISRLTRDAGGKQIRLQTPNYEDVDDTKREDSDANNNLVFAPRRVVEPSLSIFDKRRHFEVLSMEGSEKDSDNEERSEERDTTNTRHSIEKLKKIFQQDFKPLNRKRDPNVSDGTRGRSFRKKDFERSMRREYENSQNSSTSLFSRQDIVDLKLNSGRRPGSSLRELKSRTQQQDNAQKNGQKMQNDYLPMNDTLKGNGNSANSESDLYIPYNEKIRKLNAKLNDPFYAKTLNSMGVASASEVIGIECDFEKPCPWQWNTTEGGFEVMTAADILNRNSSKNYLLRGPDTDADFNDNGHFLFLEVGPHTEVMTVKSPEFYGVMEKCRVEVSLYQQSMMNASFKVIAESAERLAWVLNEVQGNNLKRWNKYSFTVGRPQGEFHIVLEVVSSTFGMTTNGFIALDNMKMVGCFAEIAAVEECSPRQLRCMSSKVPTCINSSRVCDIPEDCDQGEDERQDCDKMPFGSRCSFEDGWCGWSNTKAPKAGLLNWERHSGPTPTPYTGPENDHTCQGRTVIMPGFQSSNLSAVNNSAVACVGRYLYVNMNGATFGSDANLDSQIFNPPPKVHGDVSSQYYNSCMIRFYYHQYGKNSGSITLLLIEMKDKENSSRLIWRSSKNQGEEWLRAVVILPNVTTRYYFQLEARRGMRVYSDIAIDDFSMAPECFGLNIPLKNLGDYNYYNPVFYGANTKPHKDFENETYYEINTCGAKGRFGPSQEQCDTSYMNTSVSVRVMNAEQYRGVQAWTVPAEGFYTVIAHGAGGGLGSGGLGFSRGGTARAIVELHKGQVLYALIGQKGTSACIKSLSIMAESNCRSMTNNTTEGSGDGGTPYYYSKTHEVKNTIMQDGGGGGGGGTFLFLVDKDRAAFPLLVGGGGGGLGAGRLVNGETQHGKGSPPQGKRPHTGHMYGPPSSTPGAGGGWSVGTGLVTAGHEEVRGGAASLGGVGGRACSGIGVSGAGGFGGGGGGCVRGGAGGGWAGGDTSQNMTNGEGGYSFVELSWTLAEYAETIPGGHSGSGQLIIIPAISGCGCDYRCIALDEYRHKTKCICPAGWIATGVNKSTCELFEDLGLPQQYVLSFFSVMSVLLVLALAGILLMLYNRYQVKKQAALRHKTLLEQDLRLSRLRSTADESGLTNFNPNYGCDSMLAGGIDVRLLPQVARESLRLVKALGQGAFGEVYQGLYRHRDGDAIEMPVAVKTLPEMSTAQSERDFVMEAAIMAKFNHPNIVHLIGVCFDSHPRFIVLELLAGGDLKNFLRENRPRPERSSSLTMKDLVLSAIDVSKGCRYMESKRFIHRDIAARNCLLTSKGPGRVVKIADFGMARDVYRCDYYKKGGKAMLPIKWMPPEAFLDGIFTSKTDIWSFGVLLWEVFSLGIMPYTGCANREVMQMVTGGGRLDIPPGCPIEIYRIMCDCWNPTPQDRPTFGQLFERLTQCSQDNEMMAMALPCFRQINARELEGPGPTVNRGGSMLLQGGLASDYLVPLLPVAPAVLSCNGSNSMVLTQELPSTGEAVVSTAQNASSSVNGTINTVDSPSAGKAVFKQIYPPEYGNIAISSMMNNPYEMQNNINDDGSRSNNETSKQGKTHNDYNSVRYQSIDNTVKLQNDSLGRSSDSGYCSKSSDISSSKLDHTSKFQPSKSTDRLLASMEAASGSQDEDEVDDVKLREEEWETSFTEPPVRTNSVGKSNKQTGPAVEKLISIDTPQQTPTALQPPDTTFSKLNYTQSRPNNHVPPKETNNITIQKTPSLDQTKDSPPYKMTGLPMNNSNYVKHRPLCLDAAQLEQNLNALKKNSGSVNLNNMNILPPYVNVLTPNKLAKKTETRKIQIDPKKAVIHDLASPPGVDVTPDARTTDMDKENKLKTSSSSHSLINGPLTDLPYADSDNASSSSSSGTNVISKINPTSKQNNYSEVTILEEPQPQQQKLHKKQNSTGGYLNNDSEISC